MFNKAKPAADAYTFSLRGMTTIASFAAVPVVADDWIRSIRDDRRRQDCDESEAPAWLPDKQPEIEGSAA